MNRFFLVVIWESLGGDQEWKVRFFAQHSAIVYFFVLIVLWILSPSLAYNFSELIEAHAVDTYAEFAESNRELLQSMPPPLVAKAYYEAPDMYVFDEFQVSGFVVAIERFILADGFCVLTRQVASKAVVDLSFHHYTTSSVASEMMKASMLKLWRNAKIQR